MTAALLATVHNGAGAIWFLGVVFIFGCLIAAAVAAWRGAWVVAAALAVVAIVAAFLLL
jgi:hypothetical protein